MIKIKSRREQILDNLFFFLSNLNIDYYISYAGESKDRILTQKEEFLQGRTDDKDMFSFEISNDELGISAFVRVFFKEENIKEIHSSENSRFLFNEFVRLITGK